MDATMVTIHAINADKPIHITASADDNNINPITIAEDDTQKTIPMSDDIIIHKGYSPFICEETGTWFEYDNKLKAFVDTGVIARGDLDPKWTTQIQQNTDNIKTLDETKISEEVDPTVPEWAKSSTKPGYNASEIGAVDVNNTIGMSEIDRLFNVVFG